MLWNLSTQSKEEVKSLSRGLGVSGFLAQLLINRGFDTAKEAEDFLNPDKTNSYSPFDFANMEFIATRLCKAIENNEGILVYGDYDVDGSSSVALLGRFLSDLGCTNVHYLQPNRVQHGYGFHAWSIDYAKENNLSLIVTVDCGVTDKGAVNRAKKEKIDVIITDHHRIVDEKPDTPYLLLPHLSDDSGASYPNKDIAGVGVAFQLARATAKILGKKPNWQPLIELLTIGTIADVADLTGENRTFVFHGLSLMKTTSLPGLDALLRVAGCSRESISPNVIGFQIAPRLNSAGRMDDPNIARQLLQTDDRVEADTLAGMLNDLNKKRQRKQEEIYKIFMEGFSANPSSRFINIAVGNDIHPGIIGLVASSLQEKSYKPSVVISLINGKGIGSCRSIPSFDIIDALRRVKGYFLRLGGHPQAAGFMIEEGRIEDMKRDLISIAEEMLTEADMQPSLTLDAFVDINEIRIDLIREIEKLAPFGQGNPYPLLASLDVGVVNSQAIGNGKHLKVYLKASDGHLEAVYWNMGHLTENLRMGDRINIAYEPSLNTFNGLTRIQLQIKDMIRI